MPKLELPPGRTSQTLLVFIQDSSSTVGAGLIGLLFNSAGLSAFFYREGDGTGATPITLATQTLGTWATGGFIEVDQADMPGVYELGIPNAAFASGVDFVTIMYKGATNMAPLVLEVQLKLPVVTEGETLGVSSGAATSVNVTSIGAAVIGAADFAAGAIDASAIAPNALGASELATDAVEEIRDSVIAALGTPVGANILADIATLQGDTDNIQTRIPAALIGGAMDADVSAMQANVITAAAIAANAIENAAIATNAIDNLNLTIGTISAGTFAAGAISNAAMGANAISAAKIATDAIVNAAIAADAIGSSELQTDSIGSAELATTAVNEIRDAVIAALGTPVGANILADIATLQGDTDNIQTRIPAALIGGAMDADVSAMQANVITAAAIAADAITSSQLAATAAQKIRDEILPTQNAQFLNIPVLFVAASDHVTPVTVATGAAVTRSIDGAAFAPGTGTFAEVGNGIYQYDASAADMNGGVIIFRFRATGGTPGAPDDTFVTVVTGGGV